MPISSTIPAIRRSRTRTRASMWCFPRSPTPWERTWRSWCCRDPATSSAPVTGSTTRSLVILATTRSTAGPATTRSTAGPAPTRSTAAPGADTMAGGTGDDTYVVDDALDVVTEAADEGTDTVQASITYTLGDDVENLTLTGSADIDGTGNALANTIIGNSGNNIVTGGGDNDALESGDGNDTRDAAAVPDRIAADPGDDTYVVDNALDVVTEVADEGTDLVQASVSYTLSANVENLTLTGSANINGTGNTLANIITGNSANNTLDGGAGADTLIGGDRKS